MLPNIPKGTGPGVVEHGKTEHKGPAPTEIILVTDVQLQLGTVMSLTVTKQKFRVTTTGIVPDGPPFEDFRYVS